MEKLSPYKTIKRVRSTEKSRMLSMLCKSDTNKCDNPKVTFIVDVDANKSEIAKAIELIYDGVTVVKVNIINMKPKGKQYRGRGVKAGKTRKTKKAVITLKQGDEIEGVDI